MRKGRWKDLPFEKMGAVGMTFPVLQSLDVKKLWGSLNKDYTFRLGTNETVDGLAMYALNGSLKKKNIPKEMTDLVKSVSGQARILIGRNDGFPHVWEAGVKFEPKEEQPFPLGHSVGIVFSEVKLGDNLKPEVFQFTPPTNIVVQELKVLTDEPAEPPGIQPKQP